MPATKSRTRILTLIVFIVSLMLTIAAIISDRVLTKPEASMPAPIVAGSPFKVESDALKNAELDSPDIITEPTPDALETPAVETPAVKKELVENWREYMVKKGDTLGGIFHKLSLPQAELVRLLAASKRHAKALKKIKPGQVLRFLIEQNNLIGFALPVHPKKDLLINRTSGQFAAQIVEKSVRTHLRHFTGQIDQSFYLDAKKAGLTDGMVMSFAEIFAWDIDFVMDVRDGDQFQLVVEEQEIEDRQKPVFEIVAARFVNQNKVFEAVRFQTEKHGSRYYTPEGRSLQKAFLRAPLKFSHISSHFNPKRKHPILNIIRAHKGVDYAAKQGTPVRAAGDGKVSFAKRKGGYGNVVMIKHGTKYETKYAHLSRFAKGIRPGKSVRQGQVIGYVGKTGAATGPHLHYEFLVGGVHRNPRTVKLPQAKRIAKRDKANFVAQTTPYVSALASLAKDHKVDAGAVAIEGSPSY